MLQKSLTTNADTIIYDLEDSVAASQKTKARNSLIGFLRFTEGIPESARISVRVNAEKTAHFEEDIRALGDLPTGLVSTVVLPKVEDQGPMLYLLRNLARRQFWNVIASIESATAMERLHTIANFKNRRVRLSALLVSICPAKSYPA
jgi:citrate lyase subunit beta-like protein